MSQICEEEKEDTENDHNVNSSDNNKLMKIEPSSLLSQIQTLEPRPSPKNSSNQNKKDINENQHKKIIDQPKYASWKMYNIVNDDEPCQNSMSNKGQNAPKWTSYSVNQVVLDLDDISDPI